MITEWAKEQDFQYTAELTGKYSNIRDFLNNIAKMLANEAELAPNPLDDYVWQEDSHFEFHKIATTKKADSTIHHLHLTSQKWQNESLTSQ